jgi:hypothetical protein
MQTGRGKLNENENLNQNENEKVDVGLRVSVRRPKLHPTVVLLAAGGSWQLAA